MRLTAIRSTLGLTLVSTAILAVACGAPVPLGASSETREDIVVADEHVIEYTQRDATDPIYDPTFISADDADLEPLDVVIGVSFGGEAKAYPESVLSGRGLVNDTISGRPILVSW